MSDFKSYTSDKNNKGTDSTKNTQNSTNAPTEEQTANMATMLAKAFGGKSEGQIWKMILEQAEQGKRDGTLTNADLDNFYNTVAPLVDGFKRQKLKGIIAKLKQI
ncbi:MAG: hypothetical protein ACI4MS_07385 [Candidatus Coproplasma sp.]